MGIKKLIGKRVRQLGGAVLSSGMVIVANVLQAPALEQGQPQLRQQTLSPVAQTADPGCRQTNSTTGVYEQPNLNSTSRGILPGLQTVRLELTGTGTGWARITAPVVGWVEAKYLSPPTSCTTSSTPPSPQVSVPSGQISTPPVQTPPAQISTPPAQVSPSPQPTTQPTQPIATRPVAPVTVVCTVLPPQGLVVRSQPNISDNTALSTIPQGVHQFQFTGNNTVTQGSDGDRRWAYITSPQEGWISLGFAEGFNLGGRECG